MTHIWMVPSTLRAGAATCRTVAREMSASARRVQGLGAPEGMPPEAIGELHALAPQLQRSAIAAEREAIILQLTAHNGLLADGPLGALMGLVTPPVLSPWAMPAGPERPEPDTGPRAGIADDLKDIAVSTYDTAIGLFGHIIDSKGGHVSDKLAYVKKRREQLDAAATYAYDHPGDFTLEMLKSAIAYDDFSEHRPGHGAGRVIVSGVGFFAPWSKALEAARAGRAAEEAASAARRPKAVRNRMADDRTRVKAELDFRLQVGDSRWDAPGARARRIRELQTQLAVAEARLDRAQRELDPVTQAARDAHANAAEARHEAKVHTAKEVRNAAGETAIKTLHEHEAEP